MSDEKTPAQEPEVTYAKELLEKDYEASVLKSALPVVVDFYTADAEPDKTLAPRFGAVAEKFNGKVVFFKVLRQGNLPLAEKLKVTETPTLVFFKSGVEFGERLKGPAILRTALKAQVEALLK